MIVHEASCDAMGGTDRQTCAYASGACHQGNCAYLDSATCETSTNLGCGWANAGCFGE